MGSAGAHVRAQRNKNASTCASMALKGRALRNDSNLIFISIHKLVLTAICIRKSIPKVTLTYCVKRPFQQVAMLSALQKV